MSGGLVDLGITGSREQPNEWQLAMLDALLRYHRQLGFSVLHHGDCVGSDLEAAKLARGMGYTVHGHPPDNDSKRAFFPSDVEDAPLPFLHRDDVIALASQAGIAVPSTTTPVTRSGTWYTVRRFKAAHRPMWIIAPSTMWAVTA